MSKRHVVFCYIVLPIAAVLLPLVGGRLHVGAHHRGGDTTAPPRRGPALGEYHAAYSGSAQRHCRHAIEGEIMRLKLKLVDDTGTEHWTAGGMCHLSYSPRTRR